MRGHWSQAAAGGGSAAARPTVVSALHSHLRIVHLKPVVQPRQLPALGVRRQGDAGRHLARRRLRVGLQGLAAAAVVGEWGRREVACFEGVNAARWQGACFIATHNGAACRCARPRCTRMRLAYNTGEPWTQA
jgi:hypothetical protein